MTVLITKANEPLIKEFYPKATFTESTTNTSTFKIHGRAYNSLHNKLRKADITLML